MCKQGFPVLWFPGRLSDMDWSHALAPDPGIGAKVLMARATIAALAASDRRALWTYKGRRLKEEGAGGGRGGGRGAIPGPNPA